jgi:hypothetical protein
MLFQPSLSEIEADKDKAWDEKTRDEKVYSE